MVGTAIFSPDERYRYVLTRSWTPTFAMRELGLDETTSILYIALNPSTATEAVDDPTVRRIIRFAHDDCWCELVLCNAFAFRSTDPSELRAVDDPVGPENDEHIRACAERADKIVLCWGRHGSYLGRGNAVVALLRAFDLYCLGTNKAGEPSHPLYLPGTRRPQLWRTAA